MVIITVNSVELKEIGEKYYADEDGLISLDEAIIAVNYFFSGAITRDEALEVVAPYLKSPATVADLLAENA